MRARDLPRVVLLLAAGLCPIPGGALPAADCNRNGVEDGQEIESGESPDCNGNRIPDACDVEPAAWGFSTHGSRELDQIALSLATADVDGDGLVDAVTGTQDSDGGGLSLYLNGGNGSFSTPQLRIDSGGRVTTSVVVADFDGDGTVDLAASNIGTGSVSILIGTGGGSFRPAVLHDIEKPRTLASADLDGDADLDLVVTSELASRVMVLWNDGLGRFTDSLGLAVDPEPVAVAAGDMDGDGDLDLVAGHTSGGITVIRNDGGRSFSGPTKIPGLQGLSALVLADLDGDSDLDVAFSSFAFDSAAVARNRGDGTLEPVLSYHAGTRPSGIIAADLDADGDIDLGTVNPAGSCDAPLGTVTLLRNPGNGVFHQLERLPGGPGSEGGMPSISVAEVTGDGRPDIITAAGAVGEARGALTVLRAELQPRSLDCNSNGVPDECEADCDWNGVADECDIAAGLPDENGDGRTDSCEPDCNSNSLPDSLDLARGTSSDLDGSGFPDECEAAPIDDCNGNQVADSIDLREGTSLDCNSNALPDECDISPGFQFSSYEGFTWYLPQLSGGVPADLDGDGDLDIVLARRASCCPSTLRGGALSILKNLGGGAFSYVGTQFIGSDPVAVVAADLDGDGDVDLATASSSGPCKGSDAISILFNTGGGVLSPPSRFAPGGRPRNLAAADLDGDGDADLAVPCQEMTATMLRVFRNDGSGHFATAGSYLAGTDAMPLVLADLDGRPGLDMAVADRGSSSVRILLNQGGAAFSASGEVAAGPMRPLSIAAGDLDGDGDADLAAATLNDDATLPPVILVLRNGGGGAFQSKEALAVPSQPTLALIEDADGDGSLDVLASGEPLHRLTGVDAGVLTVIRNPGAAFDPPETFPLDGLPMSLSPGDFDGDGDLDLLAGHATSFSVVRNEGGAAFRTRSTYAGGSFPSDIAAADLDADGAVDLAVTDQDGSLLLYWNRGHGSFTEAESRPLGATGRALDAGDLDGDGDSDLAVAASFKVEVLLNQRRRALTRGASFPVGSSPVSIVLRDLDADGDLDIATANSLFTEFTDNVSIFKNLGGGRFASGLNFAVGVRPAAMACADFDRDGDLDLAVLNTGSGDIRRLSNDGTGVFSSSAPALPAPSDFLLTAVDLEGDGDMDLVTAGQELHAFVNRGGGELIRAPESIEIEAEGRLVAADLDRDSDPDLITGYYGRIRVAPNRGNGTFDSGQMLSPRGEGEGGSDTISPRITGIAAADLDGDGILDLAACVFAEDSQVAVFLNRTPRASQDIDGDGVPDECSKPDVEFRRGDSNQDALMDITDAVYVLRHLFHGGSPISCEDSADANDDGRLDVSDAVSILASLFLGDPPLPEPLASCGPDPAEDLLGCEVFTPCR